MKSFEVQFRYEDRSGEHVQATKIVAASNLPGGVAKATREFVKSLDRKQRFDMNKNGLEIKAKTTDASAGQGESEAASAS